MLKTSLILVAFMSILPSLSGQGLYYTSTFHSTNVTYIGKSDTVTSLQEHTILFVPGENYISITDGGTGQRSEYTIVTRVIDQQVVIYTCHGINTSPCVFYILPPDEEGGLTIKQELEDKVIIYSY